MHTPPLQGKSFQEAEEAVWTGRASLSLSPLSQLLRPVAWEASSSIPPFPYTSATTATLGATTPLPPRLLHKIPTGFPVSSPVPHPTPSLLSTKQPGFLIIKLHHCPAQTSKIPNPLRIHPKVLPGLWLCSLTAAPTRPSSQPRALRRLLSALRPLQPLFPLPGVPFPRTCAADSWMSLLDASHPLVLPARTPDLGLPRGQPTSAASPRGSPCPRATTGRPRPLPESDHPPATRSDLPGQGTPTSARGVRRASRRRAPAAVPAFPSRRVPLWRALLSAAAGRTRRAHPHVPVRRSDRLHPGPTAAQLPPNRPRRCPNQRSGSSPGAPPGARRKEAGPKGLERVRIG